MSSSSYVDRTAAAVEFCESLSVSHPELEVELWAPLMASLREKLWHQLTRLLFQAYSTTGRTGLSATEKAQLYHTVVLAAVDRQLHPLSVARLAVLTAHALSSSSDDTDNVKATAQSLLDDCLSKVAAAEAAAVDANDDSTTNESPVGLAQARMYLQSHIALLALQGLSSSSTSQSSSSSSTIWSSIGGIGGGLVADETTRTTLSEIRTVLRANAAALQDADEHTTTTTIVAVGGVDSYDGPSNTHCVQAAHCEAVMQYYRLVGPPASFYEHALHYLQYAATSSSTTTGTASSNTTTMEEEDDAVASTNNNTNTIGSLALAVDLAVAALIGTGLYNLTPLVTEHAAVLAPLLAAPQNDEFYKSVHRLVHAVAVGDLSQSMALLQQQGNSTTNANTKNNSMAAMAAALLTQHALVVREKATLIALVTAVGALPAHDRNLPFARVQQLVAFYDDDDAASNNTAVVVDVERILMRAFCLGLLRGTMDQCAGSVDITWVQPRRLTAAQMQEMAGTFGAWAVRVHQTAETVAASTTSHHSQQQQPVLSSS